MIKSLLIEALTQEYHEVKIQQPVVAKRLNRWLVSLKTTPTLSITFPENPMDIRCAGAREMNHIIRESLIEVLEKTLTQDPTDKKNPQYQLLVTALEQKQKVQVTFMDPYLTVTLWI